MSNATINDSNNIPKFRAAYQQIADEIAAVPDDELQQISVDILAVTTKVMGALPEIMALRPQFVSHLPLFDIQKFDKLETYTLAANHAHTQFLGADTPAEAIPELSEQATSTRELLLSDASALAKRGYLNPAKLQELKGANGHRNTASDVLTLAGILRDNWSKISGKTGVALEELDAAESLGYRLLNAVGFREQGPSTIAAVSLTRHRAYSLFVTAYDQVRRGVSYLRWNEDDADDIAPSLYEGRGGRKVTSDLNQKPNAVTPAGAVAGTTPAQPPNGTGATPAQPVPVGLPGANPFVQ